MLKRFLEKWRLWEDALVGIDDLQGDHMLSLEKRIARLEAAVAEVNNVSGGESQRGNGRAVP